MTAAASVSRFDLDQARRLVPTVVVAHLALLSYLAGCHYFLLPGHAWGTALVRASVVNWDAEHYLKIAQEGYTASHLAVFFPVYPLAIALVGWLIASPLAAALLISGIAHVTACCLLYLLVALDEEPAVARRAVFCLLAFPTGFVCVLPYTESLFLALLLGSAWCYRTGRFGWAGVLGALCTGTRVVGLALVGFFVAEALVQRTGIRRASMLALVSCLGLLSYLAVNAVCYGDPFYFLEVQRTGFVRQLTWLPTVGLERAWLTLQRDPPENLTVGVSDMLGVGLVWITTLFAFRRLRASYAVLCLLTALLLTAQSWWLSSLRYVFVLFPLHHMLARVSGREWVRVTLLLSGILLQALLAMQFARGQWAM